MSIKERLLRCKLFEKLKRHREFKATTKYNTSIERIPELLRKWNESIERSLRSSKEAGARSLLNHSMSLIMDMYCKKRHYRWDYFSPTKRTLGIKIYKREKLITIYTGDVT